ncbi:hypothetical protein O181_102325 [Austropuccinia psidii MF-1]|uniref:Thioesterase domain-containing protein n=1 Tax=Austropuccinia psidii MF-1 TaxID=1389203 RepID=A0A9Q3PIN0_9BASI|nr:hypothetical protein [Austropuccinia psidii MF-1]
MSKLNLASSKNFLWLPRSSLFKNHYQDLQNSHRHFFRHLSTSSNPHQLNSCDNHDSDKSSLSTNKRNLALISITTLSIGYSLGTIYPPDITTQIIANTFFRPLPPSLNNLNPSDSLDHTQAIENSLQNLKLVKELKNKPQIWKSSRPFTKLDPQKLTHNLTGGTLRGPGKFAIPPQAFINHQETEAIIIVHLGRSLCGHDGIIHGGLLATICDEGLARLAFCHLPSKVGVTASLKLQYRKPAVADQFVVLKAWIPANDPEKLPQGRKVWVHGRIETLHGDHLVDTEALFVEPKVAKFLDNSKIKDILS